LIFKQLRERKYERKIERGEKKGGKEREHKMMKRHREKEGSTNKIRE